VFALLLITSVLPAMAETRDGQTAPAFKLSDLNGGTVSLADLHGSLVVIHFAASW